jgi:N6-L-threonylcarbamoyladenine synthase
VIAPPPVLCTDNGAMIAACGYYRVQAGNVAPLDLDVEPGLRIG